MPSRPLIVAISLCMLATACGSAPSAGVTANRSDASGGTNTPDEDSSAAPTTPEGNEPSTDTTVPDDQPNGDPSTPPATEPAAPVEPAAAGGGSIDWQSAGPDLESGILAVPIDYDDPSKGTFDLFVVRHLAADPSKRIGSLLVNPGGPGFGGTVLAQAAEQVYSQDLVDHFDIVAWDPRGTGYSEPAIDCIDDYDRYYAASYEGLSDEEARQLSRDLASEFEQKCESKNADIIRYVGTNNSARDMNAIREALGEDTISYFGFSYGSELGGTWATLFPDTVRATVLDGAADPNADALEGSLQQSRGFEASLNTFLAQCSADSSCSFYNDGDAEGAFDALMDSLAEDPIPSDPGRPDVDSGLAASAVIEAMYSESLWPELADALTAAQDGEGSGLLALFDSYYQRQPDGSYDNSLEAFQVISCADTAERLTPDEEDAQIPLYTEAAPRLYGDTSGGSYFCTYFPESIDPRVEITGAGPILVVGTTGDPATPLESSRNMANSLEEGVLLIVEADQHTGYDVNDCSMSTVDAYLIDLIVPPDGTMC